MGRLGKSNMNMNMNMNMGMTPAVLEASVGALVRFNSQEFRKLMRPDQFPAEPRPEHLAAYEAAQRAVNGVRFREYWDAELRAYVYLNEFVGGTPGWLEQLINVIGKKGLHDRLQREKGAQLREILDVADNREERFSEVLDQHTAEGSIKYWLGMLMIDPASAPATYQLIRAARRIGELAAMCLKQHYREARPSQICPLIVPMVDPPVTPSFPSGHALQARLISLCLAAAGRPPGQPDLLFELSRRIAENRVIAGLHYPLDNEAGEVAAEACFTLMQRGEQFAALVRAARDEAVRELATTNGTPRT